MVNTFNQYLHTDVSPVNQPDGTYTFAKNLSPDSIESSLGSLPNELGNELQANLSLGQTLIGATLTDTDDIIVFSAGATSEIGTYNTETKVYTSIVVTKDLNFSVDNPPVDGLFRNRKGCERTVYFTDRVNPYRAINLDLLDQYKDENGNFVANRFSLTPDYLIPKIVLDSVSDSGGQLTIGAYTFSIRYLDTDLNPSNYFIPTDPVYIYDENIGAAFETINGGSPLASEDGGVAPSTKSIVLALSNLDTNQRYYQIAVSHSIGATGTVTATYLTPPRFIYGDTDTFVYAENNESQDTIESLNNIIVDNELIEVVQAHAQTDNTLFLANLSSTQYDYAKFQQAANLITVKYTTEAADPYDQTSKFNNKSPLYVRSLMGDEIYALSVEWLYKNGSTSPAFHIPGRVAFTSDRTIVLPGEETKHLLTQPSYQKWQVTNTATTDGVLAYHESRVAYPDTTDCDGLRIYPEGQIRHHKMPCRSIVPVHDESNVYPIGLIFDNITYPHPDIVGHRFLVSIRGEGNSTVLDTGITVDLSTEAGFDATGATALKTEFQGLGFENERPFHNETVVITPKNLVYGQTLPVSHIKFNYKLNQSFSGNTETKYDKNGGGKFKVSTTAKEFQTNSSPLSFTNRAVDGNIYIGADSTQLAIQGFEYDLQSTSKLNTFNFFHSIDTITTTGYSYVCLKQEKDIFTSLESILYRPLAHNFLTLTDSQTVYGGDTFISELIVLDVPFYRSSDNKVNADIISKVWVESSINYGMVYGGTGDCSARYIDGNTNDYFIQKVAHLQDNDKYVLRGLFCHEFYGYNKDFSFLPELKTNTGISYTFNYCSACLNSYPFQVRFSKTSYIEETVDNYKIFLSNNAKSLDGSSGPINNLIVDKDQLYASTDKDMIFLSTRPQTMNTDSTVVYLGTGEKLSVPAKKLVSIPQGYSGTEDFNSFVSTQYGTFYVSSNTGKVILLSDKLEEISMYGMNNFFKNNLRGNLEDYFSNYNLRNRPYHKNGSGVIAGFNPRFDQYIIHKRDYKPLFGTSLTKEENTIRFENGEFYYTLNGFSIKIDLTNPTYFENKSFTISYNAKAKKWTSFHSWNPNFFIFNSQDMFTTTLGTGIYKHNEGDYCTYYGKHYDSVLEYVIKSPLAPMVFSNTELSVEGEFYYKALLYNSHQSTGYQSIEIKNNSNPFTDAGTLTGTVLAQQVDTVWRMSNFRDMSTSNIVTSNNWLDIQTDYYTDIAPVNIDYSKPLFEQARLRGQFLKVRLFNNSTDLVTLNYVNTNQERSFR